MMFAKLRLVTVVVLLITSTVFGCKSNEERLKQVIKESVKPKPVERKPFSADVERMLAWSEPVGGLAARIEDVCDWGVINALVRLKNASEHPIIVPSGNPKDKDAVQLFEIYVRQGDGPWRQAAWTWGDIYCEQSAPDEVERDAYHAEGIRGLQIDRPMVTLQPGEHCLACVRAYDKEDTGQHKEFKVVLRRPQASAEGQWSGVLETPLRFARKTDEQFAANLAGVLPIPEHFPTLSYAFTGISWSGDESVIQTMWYSNYELVNILSIYNQVQVCKEFESCMRAELRPFVKMFLAVLAARSGSEEAALFLLEKLKCTDYKVRVNLHEALYRLFPPDAAEAPAWVVELSMAVLADNRFVTGLEKTNFAEGTYFTIESCETRNLESALCRSKCIKALPLLIERLKKGNSRSLAGLGEMGDQRAIPFLIEMTEAAGKKAKYLHPYDRSEQFFSPAYAISLLKAREAVPLLLQYIEYPEIIIDLGDIGDSRVVPILEDIVSAKGKIMRDGKNIFPELQAERLFAAKVALAGFDKDKGVTRLGEMLSDQSLTVHQRYDVAIYLGRRNDSRSIPYFVNAIKAESRYQPDHTMESRHYLIDVAIYDLGTFKCKAAVEGLIECFDLDFKEESLGKGEDATPATYRNSIARSLQAITGQTIGADKEQWLKWWGEKGKQNTKLK